MKVSIVVKGGLGNQLFIYAFFSSFLSSCYSKINIDISSFKSDKYSRDFLLKNLFLAHKSYATTIYHRSFINKIAIKLSETSLPTFLQIILKFTLFRVIRVFNDNDILSFRPQFNGSAIFNGYWQNKIYPHSLDIDAIHQIAESLKVNLFESHNPDIPTVAVHLREKDYDYKLESSYYIQSISYLKSKIPKFRVFFFSESNSSTLDKVQSYLTSINIDSEEILPGSALDDFRIMSQCDHFIIAKSTYSWWSAFLKSRISDSSIVIIPKSLGFISNDSLLIPSEWVQF